MLDELQALFGTAAFESSGGIVLASIRWPGRGCSLTLDVHTGEQTSPRQVWQVRCDDFRASRVSGTWAYDAALTRSHPVLLPFVHPHAKLSFRGEVEDSRCVVADLWEAHEKATDLWHPFEAFLNPSVGVRELLASGNGVLAEGPVPLLQSYAQVLRSHEVEPSLFAERPPLRWLDGAWQSEPPDTQVFVFGDSYVVGSGFAVERGEPSPAEHGQKALT